jgi:hypothetical protein
VSTVRRVSLPVMGYSSVSTRYPRAMNDAKRRYSAVSDAVQVIRDVGNDNEGQSMPVNEPIWTEII